MLSPGKNVVGIPIPINDQNNENIKRPETIDDYYKRVAKEKCCNLHFFNN